MRAVAVFMVIAWHFAHGAHGDPIPFEYVPAVFPFSILDEGHTGVALFMTLSGYLFARLLDGKSIDYAEFLRNRALRLVPLLLVVIGLVGLDKALHGESLAEYGTQVLKGFVWPTLPNGAWSITVEFHFYAVLPLLLWMLRRSSLLPLGIVATAIVLRAVLREVHGEVQQLAYWTMIGRIDQFVLGMLAYQLRARFAGRHAFAFAVLGAFAAAYWEFDRSGGFFHNPAYPSPSALWIVLPTIEGIAYGILIAWYDGSFSHSSGGFSRFVGRIGEYSYSIYLLHFFFVFAAAQFVHERIMALSNFYLACAWALVFLLLMMPLAALVFRCIESPFLRMRRSYVSATSGSTNSHSTSGKAA